MTLFGSVCIILVGPSGSVCIIPDETLLQYVIFSDKILIQYVLFYMCLSGSVCIILY